MEVFVDVGVKVGVVIRIDVEVCVKSGVSLALTVAVTVEVTDQVFPVVVRAAVFRVLGSTAEEPQAVSVRTNQKIKKMFMDLMLFMF